MWVSVVERGLSGYGFPKRRHAKVQKSSNYLDVAVATGDAQRTSFSGSYTVTGYMRQQETNDLEPPAPARRVKRGNIRLSGRFTVPLRSASTASTSPKKSASRSAPVDWTRRRRAATGRPGGPGAAWPGAARAGAAAATSPAATIPPHPFPSKKSQSLAATRHEGRWWDGRGHTSDITPR